MKANQNTVIVDPKLVLVPYRREHVARYHEWMTSDELREQTASEMLTLDQEYEMQRKWQVDEDKLTFIILARDDSDRGVELAEEDVAKLPMIGDANLFLKGSPEDEDFEVEAEIMIAELSYRRKGLASRALQLLFSYATSPQSSAPLPISASNLVVRTRENNLPSIEMFTKLGFTVTKRVEIFQELEMRYRGGGSTDAWFTGETRVFAVE